MKNNGFDTILGIGLILWTLAGLTFVMGTMGCGEQPTYTTLHGFKIHDNEYLTTQEQIEELTEFTFSFFADREKLEKKMSGLTVKFYDGVLYTDIRNDEEVEILGQGGIYSMDVSILEQWTCLPQSAFIHELLHTIHYWKYGHKPYENGEITVSEALGGDHKWVNATNKEIQTIARRELCRS